jgi:hypothetical protein
MVLPCGFSSGSAVARVDRNFCLQWSLQKKNVSPSRSARSGVASSTVIPQIGSLAIVGLSLFLFEIAWFSSLFVHFS